MAFDAALLAEAVLPGLPNGTFGLAGYEHHEHVDSTSTRAVQLARAGAVHGTVVVAEGQSAGRGRRGRTFSSPARLGLYLSVVLRPPLLPREAYRLTLCGALAVLQTARGVGVAGQLRWPNDVMVRGKKLSGVLTELAAGAQQVHHAVLGLGFNVNTQAEHFPMELRNTCTSLALETGRPQDRAQVLRTLLQALTAWYHAALQDWPGVLQEARKSSATLGRAVRVRDGDQEVSGDAVDLDEDGALLLRTPHGEVRVVSGDVELL